MRRNGLKWWINIAIINLCIVACLGVLMRSKMIFDMPWIDYNRLVETHGNFAFTGWVSLTLLCLMLFEFPGFWGNSFFYFKLLAGMALCSWAGLLTSPFETTHKFSEYISFLYIILTYIFAWKFIAYIRETTAGKTVKLLSVSAMLCLVLSSVGTIILSYLFATRSLNAILYRDALFGYLHLQYNGFFTLSVFAIAFNKIGERIYQRRKKRFIYFQFYYAYLLSLPCSSLFFGTTLI